MKNSGCKSVTCVVDARRPVRPTYVNLYKWPESDAEFVKSMTGGGSAHHGLTSSNNVDGSRKWNQSPSPKVVSSYSCRQMYLRSYVFSKEETATGKARHYLGKAKDRAIVLFPFVRTKSENRSVGRARREGKKTAGKLIKEISYSAIFSIFYRFLFCTGTSVEVVDHTR